MCDYSFYNKLVKQIQLETQVSTALKDLRYHLKMKVHPRVIRPRRKMTTFPMEKHVFEAIFPQAKECKPKPSSHKPLSYMSSGKVYQVELTTDELEPLIGPEWYYTYGGADVAVHVGKIQIRLIERKLQEYQTTLDWNMPTVIMDSISKNVRYFCRVEFSYRKVTRYEHSQLEDSNKIVESEGKLPEWKERAARMRAENFKKISIRRVRKQIFINKK